MAELPIERKEGRNWLPLVLLGLLLLAVLGYCATRGDDDAPCGRHEGGHMVVRHPSQVYDPRRTGEQSGARGRAGA